MTNLASSLAHYESTRSTSTTSTPAPHLLAGRVSRSCRVGPIQIILTALQRPWIFDKHRIATPPWKCRQIKTGKACRNTCTYGLVAAIIPFLGFRVSPRSHSIAPCFFARRASCPSVPPPYQPPEPASELGSQADAPPLSLSPADPSHP